MAPVIRLRPALLFGVVLFCVPSIYASDRPSTADFTRAVLIVIKKVDKAVDDFQATPPAGAREGDRMTRFRTAVKSAMKKAPEIDRDSNSDVKSLAKGLLLYDLEAVNYVQAFAKKSPSLTKENFEQEAMATVVPIMRSKQICGQMVDLVRSNVLIDESSGRLKLSSADRQAMAGALRSVDPFSVWRYGFYQEERYGCRYQDLWYVLTSTPSADGKEMKIDVSAEANIVADGFDVLVAIQEAQDGYFSLKKINDPVHVTSATVNGFWNLAKLPIGMSREALKAPTKYIPQIRELYANKKNWADLLDSLGTFVQASDLLLEHTESVYRSASEGPAPKEGHLEIQKHLSELPAEWKAVDGKARRLASALMKVIPQLMPTERKEVARYALARWNPAMTDASTSPYLLLSDVLVDLQKATAQ